MGIAKALQEFADCPDTGEGLDSAIEKAEYWRDALEEMIEISNTKQQEACTCLLKAIRMFLTLNCK